MSQFINKLTYDKKADAAYIRFVKTDESDRLTTMALPEKPIHLDFDEEGQIVGVEVLHATDYLPEELLERAVRID
jgi:uncharacterized protein YuzE